MNDPKTARRGVIAGVTGMTVAVLATWVQPEILHTAGSSVHRSGFAVGIRSRACRSPRFPSGLHSRMRLVPCRRSRGTAEYFLWLGEAEAPRI